MRNANNTNIRQFFTFIALFFLCFYGSSLQAAEKDKSVFDMLAVDQENGIESFRAVTLRLPMDSIYAKTNNKQHAVISFIDDNTGREYRRSLHVEVRGKFRRHLCTFPPLKLDFNKKSLQADGLAKHDKLKLVTPCFEDEESQALILKEYLAYKLYEKLSPAAFRVQLLQITYRDIYRTHADQTVYAFVLEDNDEMAERLGGVEMDNGRGLAPDRFDRRAETTQALFSYFIGNLDWSLSMSRNLKMVELTNGTVIPVPYDFDFSGLVAAPYARINSGVGQQYAGQRIYLGFDCSDELLESAFDYFKSKKKEISQMIRGFRIMKLEDRYATIEYLNSFYGEFNRLQRQGMQGDSMSSLYRLLRAEQVDLIPPGADGAHYGVSK